MISISSVLVSSQYSDSDVTDMIAITTTYKIPKQKKKKFRSDFLKIWSVLTFCTYTFKKAATIICVCTYPV